MYSLFVYIYFVFQNKNYWLHVSQCGCVYYIPSTKQRSDNRGLANRSELDIKSDKNRPASVELRKSTTVSSQCDQFSYPWTWHVLSFGGGLTLKRALVLFTLLRSHKRYTGNCWLFYIPNQVGEWPILVVL